LRPGGWRNLAVWAFMSVVGFSFVPIIALVALCQTPLTQEGARSVALDKFARLCAEGRIKCDRYAGPTARFDETKSWVFEWNCQDHVGAVTYQISVAPGIDVRKGFSDVRLAHAPDRPCGGILN